MDSYIIKKAGNQSALSALKQQETPPIQSNTGIPETLKKKAEEKSGLSLDDVSVHYNSVNPSRYQALAYTQGNQVYIGPGQEKHLAHELGHVVQQKQGRVSATKTIGGQPLNDNADLEREADRYL